MKINLRLYGMSVGPCTASAALDALNLAVLIVDSTARIIFANHIAEQILAAADGIGSGPFGLVAATATLTNKLQALVRQAAGVGTTTPVGGSLALNRPSMKRPYQVLIAPLRPATVSPIGGARPIRDGYRPSTNGYRRNDLRLAHWSTI
jgi:PAS domain-containing protein